MTRLKPTILPRGTVAVILVNDLLHIRNELAPLKADLRSSNEVCECNDLKFEIETKNKTIMNLASR